ncbi:MAG: hypothetical protein IIC70_07305 [Acidobacteria bacterium]|nr:hypothetical protein [Acidobacteriota bacterium]
MLLDEPMRTSVTALGIAIAETTMTAAPSTEAERATLADIDTRYSPLALTRWVGPGAFPKLARRGFLSFPMATGNGTCTSGPSLA